MWIKLIQCRVPAENRERFARGQAQWGALSDIGGFCGQIGGWAINATDLAVIVGLWADRDTYETFMRDVHDRIFEGNGQRGTYDSIDVSLWNSLLPIPGTASPAAAAVRSAGVVRLARCHVKPDRTDHFIEAQRTIWNPGMAAAGGMLAGWFSRRHQNPDEFLVCTLWQDLHEHRRYREGLFAQLRRRAEVDHDCTHVDGRLISVADDWRVVPR